MKHQLFFFFTLILCTTSVFSQKDFRKGYIINNEGDTIYGYLDYRGNKSSAIKCLYKPDLKQDAIVYKPSDIKCYRFIDGKYYVSKSLNDSLDSEKLFLEYLINGIAGIYYYRDYNGEHYFIDKGDGKLIALKLERSTTTEGSLTYVTETKKYVGTLKYLMADAPSLSNEINHSSLSHKSLIKLGKDYHEAVCTSGSCIIYEKELGKPKIYFGLIGGVGLYTMASGDQNTKEEEYLNDNKFTSNLTPNIGLFFKTNFPSLNDKMFVQYDLTYSEEDLSYSYQIEYPYDIRTFQLDQSLKRQTLSQSLMLKFERQQGTFRPLIGIGGFFNYYFSSDYELKLIEMSPEGEIYSEQYNYNSPFHSIDYGISICTGVNFVALNRLMFIDLKYQIGFGLGMGFLSQNFILNLGIPFGKYQ